LSARIYHVKIGVAKLNVKAIYHLASVFSEGTEFNLCWVQNSSTTLKSHTALLTMFMMLKFQFIFPFSHLSMSFSFTDSFQNNKWIELLGKTSTVLYLRGYIQRFQDCPPAARTINGTTRCH